MGAPKISYGEIEESITLASLNGLRIDSFIDPCKRSGTFTPFLFFLYLVDHCAECSYWGLSRRIIAAITSISLL